MSASHFDDDAPQNSHQKSEHAMGFVDIGAARAHKRAIESLSGASEGLP